MGLKEDFDEQAQYFVKQFIETMKSLDEHSPEVARELALHGWYLGLNFGMGAPLFLKKMISANRFEEVDNWMANEIRDGIEYIERALIHRNPTREKLFKEGFNNHKEGRYYSAITLLLSQVDGMCKERFGKLFFSIDRNTKKMALKPSFDNVNVYNRWMLVIFEGVTAINDNTQNADKYPGFLNRHSILHGFDVGYGSELNSLKIISFLNFVNDLICFDLEKMKPR